MLVSGGIETRMQSRLAVPIKLARQWLTRASTRSWPCYSGKARAARSAPSPVLGSFELWR
jgi:hypothetical protein